MIKTTQNWEIGDCLELLPSIETGSVDMVLCDLPYQITACAWDTIIPFKPLWKEWKRITKDNAAIVLSARQPFTSMLVMSNREMFKYEWVWIKNRGTGHLNAKKHPLVGHETVLVFAEGMTTYNPQMSIGTPYKRLNCARQSTNKGCYTEMDVTTDTINDGTRYPISCIEFDKVERTSHPTQKPVALFEYLIRTHTNEGDTVHDSCLGSGTTLEVCRKTNRNCIGFEISDEWEHLYADRCMAHTPTLQSFFGEEDTT